jgi:hypothetical protein
MRTMSVGMMAATLLLGGCNANSLMNFGAAQSGIYAEVIKAEAPAWRVGSEWRYNDGYGLRVAQVAGPMATFERLDDPGQWVSRRGFLREDSQSQSVLRKIVFEDLKPGAGKVLTSGEPLTFRREYMADGQLRVHATSWTVEGREHVKVPAGEFDCIIIVMRTRSQSTDWSGFERWWYSPKAQNYVRLEYKYGTNVMGTRVLMSYKIAAEE